MNYGFESFLRSIDDQSDDYFQPLALYMPKSANMEDYLVKRSSPFCCSAEMAWKYLFRSVEMVERKGEMSEVNE